MLVISVPLGKTFVLCSPFLGVLVSKDGKPLGEVKLERTWEWGWSSRSGTDVAVTGPDGRFRFPEVTGSSFLTHEPVVTQTITVYGADRPVEIWNTDKHNYDRHGELGVWPINVICYLDGEPSSKADGLFGGPAKKQIEAWTLLAPCYFQSSVLPSWAALRPSKPSR